MLRLVSRFAALAGAPYARSASSAVASSAGAKSKDTVKFTDVGKSLVVVVVVALLVLRNLLACFSSENLDADAADADGALLDVCPCFAASQHRTVVELGEDATPKIAPGTTFIAPNATLIGNVAVHDKASVWYNARLAAESSRSASLGYMSSLGDCAVLSASKTHSAVAGHHVTIGAGAIVQGAVLADGVVVGAGARVLDGATVGKYSVIADGAVVSPGTAVPASEKWAGSPARKVADVTEDDEHHVAEACEAVYASAREHRDEPLPYSSVYRHVEELKAARA